MAKRDIELIVALAEGRLEDEAEARALTERSPKLRSVYQEQVRAIEATRTLPAAGMSEAERSALRRDLWTSLRLDPLPTPVREGWAPQRLWYVAGALVLVVGLAAVASQFVQGAGDAGGFASDRTTSEGASPGTMATTESAVPGAQPLDAGETTSREFSILAERARWASEGPPAYAADGELREAHQDCLEAAGLEDQGVLDVIEDGGWSYLVAVPQGEPVGPETPIAFVDEETCRVVHLDE